MGLINIFYSSWDSILYFLFTNSNKYTHVYWSLLSLRFIKQHLCSWPCTKIKKKTQTKPHESSTCSFYNTTNIFKTLEPRICARHIYPTLHSYMGMSMSENKFSIKVPPCLLVPKFLKDAIYLATCVHLLRLDSRLSWSGRPLGRNMTAKFSFTLLWIEINNRERIWRALF